jgi:hypothetical protein
VSPVETQSTQIATAALTSGALPPELDGAIRVACGEPLTRLILEMGADSGKRLAAMRVATAQAGGSVAPFRSFEDLVARSRADDVATILLGLELARKVRDAPDLLRRRVWAHTLRSACVAAALCELDDLFTPLHGMLAGALHDLGILALMDHGPARYKDLVRLAGLTLDGLQNLEQTYLGVSHPRVSVAIASELGAPVHVVAALVDHHAGARFVGAQRLVRLAEEADLHYVLGTAAEDVGWAVAEERGIDGDQAAWLASHVEAGLRLAANLTTSLGPNRRTA